jgi:hypothetical protein
MNNEQLIQTTFKNNREEFKEKINELLYSKARKNIEKKRMTVGSSIFPQQKQKEDSEK